MGGTCSKCKSITLFKGTDGRTILNGDGVPSTGLGNVGDFYIDTTNWLIYGPKTTLETAWGTGTSLLGTQGERGVYGGYSSDWNFDNGTTSGTTSGQFRLNNAAPASVTNIFINETNADSSDLAPFLASFNNSGAYGLIRISKVDDSNVFWMGEVTGTSDSGSEHDITVTYIIHNGTFTNTDNFVISFVQSGVDGTNGTNGTNGIDLYDSDWVQIQDYDAAEGFGLPALTNFTKPQIRVIGRHAYIRGYFLLPLATSGVPGTLLPDANSYQGTNKGNVQVFTGAAGGFTPNAAGTLTSVSPILPTHLRPTQNVEISHYQMVARGLQDTAGTHNLNFTTVLPKIRLNTAGGLYIETFKTILNDGGAVSDIENTPIRTLIMDVESGENIVEYKNWKQQFEDGAPSAFNASVVDVGAGYTNGTHTGVTTTSISGSGTGLTLTVTIASGILTAVTVTGAGSGYVDGEIVQIDDTSGVPGIGTGTTKAYVRLSTDARVSYTVSNTYPATFDGQDENHLGGFIIPFSCKYPLPLTSTETQIEADIDSMK